MTTQHGLAVMGVTPEEWREDVAWVAEEWRELRQASFDFIIEMLGSVVTAENRDAVLSFLTEQDFVRLMSGSTEEVEQAAEILKLTRERFAQGGVR